MEVLGYIASLLIGISLGLIGSGGSILTVPVMVYLFGVQPLLATSYSLFIVGSTSLVGALTNFSKGLINLRAALLFGATSMVTVFLTRKFVVPVIPEDILSFYGHKVTVSLLTMVLFAMLMLLASISMIRNTRGSLQEKECKDCLRFPKLMTYGVIIGIVTGFLGAGGGFLLIPALVLLLHLPMKEAIGTSLLIIALNALVGFTGDIGHFSMDWFFLITISIIAIIGIFIGNLIGKRIAGEKLKKGFGWFVLTMGIYIILKETVFK